MNAAVAHRGPDGAGLWTSADYRCGLGHRRLAVIDLVGGKQPLASWDGRYVIVCNGEIYNYRELRAVLQSGGAVFTTNSDTEVIIEAYRRWGRECLERLRGMFAFALYDMPKKELLLARDRTGIKPLYYYADSSGIVFGSELKSLLQHVRVPRRMNVSALAEYLTLGYPLMPATLFQNLYELEPGMWIEALPAGILSGRFWNWKRRSVEWDRKELLEATQTVVEASVRAHLVADVPVGAFLSGGVDSTLIASQMAELMEARPDTFTVRFGESSYNEADQAKEIARRLGTRHHEIDIKENAVDVNLVEKVMGQFDQPFADSSAIPTYLICNEIRHHVKVVISGDGGDEMFGGYPRFRHADVARQVGRLPDYWLDGASKVIHAMAYGAPSLARKGVRFLDAARRRHGGRLVSLSRCFAPDRLGEVLNEEWHHRLGGFYDQRFPGTYQDDGPGGMEFIDATIRYALPGDYLRKVDMMSSAHGVEVRVPFLGDAILDFAARLPRKWLYSHKTTKIALRSLLRSRIANGVANLPKRGFEIPLHTCLGDEGRAHVASLLTSATARIRDFVQPGYLQRLLEGFRSGRWNHLDYSRYGMNQRVYMFWSLEHWLRTWNPAY